MGWQRGQSYLACGRYEGVWEALKGKMVSNLKCYLAEYLYVFYERDSIDSCLQRAEPSVKALKTRERRVAAES